VSAPALVGVGRPTLRIRGASYPVLLPTIRDPRLHLAFVIVSLQVLGQAAFGFELSIAQILISLGTCAILEFGITFRRDRVIMWPASALLTGNGVAFVLRVPGTEHGDWWSLRGAWIFAATAAVSLLSKHVIRFRGRHLFNPSNLGLVLCFLVLGKDRADPLDFWWAPMSPWMALALALIVAGGLVILSRLRLLVIAVGFWASFAAGIGLLAATAHAMTARWHVGPIEGGYFWWVLVSSPELLVFLFFMITDPKTTPAGRGARLAYAVGVGLLAALLIAPQRTEFGAKVALLGALALVCLVRPFLERLRLPRPSLLIAPAAAAVYAGVLVAAGVPARPVAAAGAAPLTGTERLPQVTILPSPGVASKLRPRTAGLIARDLVADLRVEADALRLRDVHRAAQGASGDRLVQLRRRLATSAADPIDVPAYRLDTMRVHLEPGEGQAPPVAVASLTGTQQLTTYRGAPPMLVRRAEPVPFRGTLELSPRRDGRYLISRVRGTAPVPAADARPTAPTRLAGAAAARLAGVRLTDVASKVGLDFRQDSFRFGVTPDVGAMMGGGVCWLDYDGDGWLDLFVVNSYSEGDIGAWYSRGGLPRSALFHNVHGRFVNVSRGSGANLQLRGNGCVAADFDGDGRTDLFVTTTQDDVLLWNGGGGHFTEGARAAGVVSYGFHSGAAVADVNGDGRPDLFVAGYTDPNAPIPASTAGFPTNHQGVRDELFLNEGHRRFRDVGERIGLDPKPYDHSLGAIFTDVNGDGRPDLYVANDEDPNRLYLNEPGGPLGFHLVDVAKRYGVADPNAGMGVAEVDYNGDGRPDFFVTNSRGEGHASFRSDGSTFSPGPKMLPALTGWGDAWIDLANDGRLDLAVANGAIPVRSLEKDAAPVQVFADPAGGPGGFVDAAAALGLDALPPANGRGLAAADFDNDGRVDLAINTVGGRLMLLRPSGGKPGHWLEVSLSRFAPGAVVTAVLPDGRRLVREVHAGSSYLSSEDPRAHFGLGATTTVRELDVRLPGGKTVRLRDVRADRIVSVRF